MVGVLAAPLLVVLVALLAGAFLAAVAFFAVVAFEAGLGPLRVFDVRGPGITGAHRTARSVSIEWGTARHERSCRLPPVLPSTPRTSRAAARRRWPLYDLGHE